MTTIAGTGTAGYSGDGGTASSASLNNPLGIALDSSGNMYIADSNNNIIRKISVSSTATTNAPTMQPSSIPTILPTRAPSSSPTILPSSASPISTISTVAGSGSYSYSGDGGAATSASLNYPRGVAVDTSGNYIYPSFIQQ